jgi:hypothetical protein
MPNEKIKCNVCGEEWEIPEEMREQEMFRHIMFAHPLDLLAHPQIQKGITAFFENLGGMLADKVKGVKNV